MAGLFERGAKQLASLYKNVRYTEFDSKDSNKLKITT